MRRLFYLLGTSLVIMAIYATFFAPKTYLLSPLCTPSAEAPEQCLHSRSSLKDPPSPTYLILGFAPYWNLKKITPESLKSITHFAYFNLHLKDDGSLYTHVKRSEQDPGYTNYLRLLAGTIDYAHKPLIITFMPESQSALTGSLSSPTRRGQTISTILDVVKATKANGINIDYEPLGDISPTTQSNFTLFIQELHQKLQTVSSPNPTPILTISTYASAAIKPRLWDLRALAPITDYFVVMTYDYTMPNSTSSGPNSPLRGSGDNFEHDIIKNIAEFTTIVDSRKIILGIPFYGYEWDTVDATKYSPATSKGSTASLERIQAMIDDKTLELLWDRNTLTPYGVSTASSQTTQIYFENATSLRLKLEFVRSANLGGIALWALGYEGNVPWLWPTINALNK